MTEPAYFDELYAHADDPWGLASSPYEARKYALTVAALPFRRCRRAFEPGCAIGVLTSLLASRCEALMAWDGAPRALEQAKRRVRAPHVCFALQRVPGDWPPGLFDLVVVSELLYFLSATDRAGVRDRALATLEPGGHLVAVHWRHPFAEAYTDGDQVHAELAAAGDLRRVVHHVENDFRLDVWQRR